LRMLSSAKSTADQSAGRNSDVAGGAQLRDAQVIRQRCSEDAVIDGEPVVKPIHVDPAPRKFLLQKIPP